MVTFLQYHHSSTPETFSKVEMLWVSPSHRTKFSSTSRSSRLQPSPLWSEESSTTIGNDRFNPVFEVPVQWTTFNQQTRGLVATTRLFPCVSYCSCCQIYFVSRSEPFSSFNIIYACFLAWATHTLFFSLKISHPTVRISIHISFGSACLWSCHTSVNRLINGASGVLGNNVQCVIEYFVREQSHFVPPPLAWASWTSQATHGMVGGMIFNLQLVECNSIKNRMLFLCLVPILDDCFIL